LFGAKIKAKARAKPKEGLQTCFSMFRFVNKKNRYRRKSTEITLYIFTGPSKAADQY
jgi:hypothetical protein